MSTRQGSIMGHAYLLIRTATKGEWYEHYRLQTIYPTTWVLETVLRELPVYIL